MPAKTRMSELWKGPAKLPRCRDQSIRSEMWDAGNENIQLCASVGAAPHRIQEGGVHAGLSRYQGCFLGSSGLLYMDEGAKRRRPLAGNVRVGGAAQC